MDPLEASEGPKNGPVTQLQKKRIEKNLSAIRSKAFSHRDACWYDGIKISDGKAAKTTNCVGCGYCFSVCPTGALTVDRKAVLKGEG